MTVDQKGSDAFPFTFRDGLPDSQIPDQTLLSPAELASGIDDIFINLVRMMPVQATRARIEFEDRGFIEIINETGRLSADGIYRHRDGLRSSKFEVAASMDITKNPGTLRLTAATTPVELKMYSGSREALRGTVEAIDGLIYGHMDPETYDELSTSRAGVLDKVAENIIMLEGLESTEN